MDQKSSMPQILLSFDWVGKLGPWKLCIFPWKEEVAMLGAYDWLSAWSAGTQLEWTWLLKTGSSILLTGKVVKLSDCFMCFWIRVRQ